MDTTAKKKPARNALTGCEGYSGGQFLAVLLSNATKYIIF